MAAHTARLPVYTQCVLFQQQTLKLVPIHSSHLGAAGQPQLFPAHMPPLNYSPHLQIQDDRCCGLTQPCVTHQILTAHAFPARTKALTQQPTLLASPPSHPAVTWSTTHKSSTAMTAHRNSRTDCGLTNCTHAWAPCPHKHNTTHAQGRMPGWHCQPSNISAAGSRSTQNQPVWRDITTAAEAAAAACSSGLHQRQDTS